MGSKVVSSKNCEKQTGSFRCQKKTAALTCSVPDATSL